MIERHDSVIVTTVVGLLVPLAQLFALYVLAHGHYSPGGGFQAGVILGATYIVLALALGRETLRRRFPNDQVFLAVGAFGVLLYLLTGVVGLFGEAAFLDYAALSLGATPDRARYFGILLIETGVTIAVAATLVVVFVRLADRPPAP
jgi:multicomponent Na+:H+ antiporter subunit B